MSFKKRFAKCIERMRALLNDRQCMEITISRACMYAFTDERREDNSAATKQMRLIVPGISNVETKNQLDEFVYQFECWLGAEEDKLAGTKAKRVIVDEVPASDLLQFEIPGVYILREGESGESIKVRVERIK